MADITFKTGKTFYQIDSAIAAMFIEAGLATRFERPAKPPRGVEFSIFAAPMTGKMAVARREFAADNRCISETFYSGNPDNIFEAWRDVPEKIAADYRAAVAGAITPADAEARREREATERQRLENAMRRNREANVGVQQ